MAETRHRMGAWILMVAGAVGVVTGAVPFTINTLRTLLKPDLLREMGLAGHGVEAMGLSVEWGMLSSAMGTVLGAMLLWAGWCWLKAKASARVVTWNYVLVGLTVNVTDMLIFAFHARPGPMRTYMLFLDGIATAFPIAVTVWLLLIREGGPR